MNKLTTYTMSNIGRARPLDQLKVNIVNPDSPVVKMLGDAVRRAKELEY